MQVRFDDSANQSVGHKNPLFTKRRGNGKRRGNKMTSLQALDKAKQARAYEAIKDLDKHEEIIELCTSEAVESSIVSIINKLRGEKDLVESAEPGLTNIIADRVNNGPPLPAFIDLDPKVVFHLTKLLEVRKFAALLKEPSETSTSSVGTMFTVPPGDDFDLIGEEVVTRILLRAAFREASNQHASLEDFKDMCSKIFNKDADCYRSAFDCVTMDAKNALIERSQELNKDDPIGPMWLDSVLDKVLGKVLTLSSAQEQAENDLGSSNSDSTCYNKIQTAAKTALIKYCKLTGNDDDETIVALNATIFQI